MMCNNSGLGNVFTSLIIIIVDALAVSISFLYALVNIGVDYMQSTQFVCTG